MAYTETAEQFFQRLPDGPLELIANLGGVIEFEIEGDKGGTWTVDLDEQSVENKGVEALGKTATVLVRARERDFMALVEGRMTPQDGVLTERLHLAGDGASIAQAMVALETLRQLGAE
jgi:putative sterol carrier protein